MKQFFVVFFTCITILACNEGEEKLPDPPCEGESRGDVPCDEDLPQPKAKTDTVAKYTPPSSGIKN